MHKLLISILKILLLFISININAEQELVEQNIVIDGGFSTDGGSSHLFAAYE